MPNEKKRRKLNDENEINNFENLEEIALVHPSPLSLAPQNSARRFTPGNPSICKLILIFHFVNLLICWFRHLKGTRHEQSIESLCIRVCTRRRECGKIGVSGQWQGQGLVVKTSENEVYIISVKTLSSTRSENFQLCSSEHIYSITHYINYDMTWH